MLFSEKIGFDPNSNICGFSVLLFVIAIPFFMNQRFFIILFPLKHNHIFHAFAIIICWISKPRFLKAQSL